MPGVPTREEVWKRFGPPVDQLGSVNDPRTKDEYGVTWNEKWVYRSDAGDATTRVVLWNRYDYLGVFRISADGEAEPEAGWESPGR